MEERKVGQREYGITAHRVVDKFARVYRVQANNNIYEIQPTGHDPLGGVVGQNIEVSLENDHAYVLMRENKKTKEYKFTIVGVFPTKQVEQATPN
jgi:hypothetical protein